MQPALQSSRPVMLKSSFIALALVGCLATVATGCDLCTGVEEPSVTFTAQLAQMTPRSTWSDELELWGTPLGPEVDTWRAAIADATSVPPSSGSLILGSGTDRLHLALPFPLQAGATVTVEADLDLIGNFALFSTGPARSSVGVWLDPACDDGDLTPCRAARQQVVTGVVEVQSTSPLQLGVNLTIAYPGTSQPTRTIAGPMTFSATSGSFCNED
jgi:hypothetical protein